MDKLDKSLMDFALGEVDPAKKIAHLEKGVLIFSNDIFWLEKHFPILFVLSYFQSCLILIFNGGCTDALTWGNSIINLAMILYWVYRRMRSQWELNTCRYFIKLLKARQKIPPNT